MPLSLQGASTTLFSALFYSYITALHKPVHALVRAACGWNSKHVTLHCLKKEDVEVKEENTVGLKQNLVEHQTMLNKENSK